MFLIIGEGRGGGGGEGVVDTQHSFCHLLVMYSCIGVNMLHTQILYMTFSFRLDNIMTNTVAIILLIILILSCCVWHNN
jgi:hypothetical protein